MDKAKLSENTIMGEISFETARELHLANDTFTPPISIRYSFRHSPRYCIMYQGLYLNKATNKMGRDKKSCLICSHSEAKRICKIHRGWKPKVVDWFIDNNLL